MAWGFHTCTALAEIQPCDLSLEQRKPQGGIANSGQSRHCQWHHHCVTQLVVVCLSQSILSRGKIVVSVESALAVVSPCFSTARFRSGIWNTFSMSCRPLPTRRSFLQGFELWNWREVEHRLSSSDNMNQHVSGEVWTLKRITGTNKYSGLSRMQKQEQKGCRSRPSC